MEATYRCVSYNNTCSFDLWFPSCTAWRETLFTHQHHHREIFALIALFHSEKSWQHTQSDSKGWTIPRLASSVGWSVSRYSHSVWRTHLCPPLRSFSHHSPSRPESGGQGRNQRPGTPVWPCSSAGSPALMGKRWPQLEVWFHRSSLKHKATWPRASITLCNHKPLKMVLSLCPVTPEGPGLLTAVCWTINVYGIWDTRKLEAFVFTRYTET